MGPGLMGRKDGLVYVGVQGGEVMVPVRAPKHRARPLGTHTTGVKPCVPYYEWGGRSGDLEYGGPRTYGLLGFGFSPSASTGAFSWRWV